MASPRSVGVVLALALGVLSPRAHATPEAWRTSYTLEAQGNAAGALEALDGLTPAERTGYLCTVRRAWLLYSAGRHEESVTVYRQAVGLAHGAIEPRLGQILPLMALRRWVEAEALARDILRTDPDNHLAGRRLALVLYNLGRFDAAEQSYRDELARYPSDLEMQTGVGWCALRRGHTQEAATAFQSVLAVSADDASARAGLAATAGR